MKKIRLLLLSLLAVAVVAPASADDFPQIGATYVIDYPQISEGSIAPPLVKVLKRGSGGWHFVEFSFRTLRVVNDETIMSPTNPHKKWINFDMLIAVTEQKEAEQDGDGKDEKPPGAE